MLLIASVFFFLPLLCLAPTVSAAASSSSLPVCLFDRTLSGGSGGRCFRRHLSLRLFKQSMVSYRVMAFSEETDIHVSLGDYGIIRDLLIKVTDLPNGDYTTADSVAEQVLDALTCIRRGDRMEWVSGDMWHSLTGVFGGVTLAVRGNDMSVFMAHFEEASFCSKWRQLMAGSPLPLQMVIEQAMVFMAVSLRTKDFVEWKLFGAGLGLDAVVLIASVSDAGRLVVKESSRCGTVSYSVAFGENDEKFAGSVPWRQLAPSDFTAVWHFVRTQMFVLDGEVAKKIAREIHVEDSLTVLMTSTEPIIDYQPMGGPMTPFELAWNNAVEGALSGMDFDGDWHGVFTNELLSEAA